MGDQGKTGGRQTLTSGHGGSWDHEDREGEFMETRELRRRRTAGRLPRLAAPGTQKTGTDVWPLPPPSPLLESPRDTRLLTTFRPLSSRAGSMARAAGLEGVLRHLAPRQARLDHATGERDEANDEVYDAKSCRRLRCGAGGELTFARPFRLQPRGAVL